MADDLTAALAEIRELTAERERIIERMRAAPLPVDAFNAVQDKLADVWLPRLLAALDAALALPAQWEGKGNAGQSALEEDRHWIRQECAEELRAAVLAAMKGENGG